MEAPVVVVLAAGASERLGTPKALVQLRDEAPATPLDWLLAAARAGFDDVLVLGGAETPVLVARLAGRAEVVHHATWRAGRTGSVVAARDARPGRDLCIAPVDVPAVQGAVFRTLAETWAAAGSPERGWLAPHLGPAQAARYGHPIVIGRALLGELDAARPDQPLFELRRRAAPLLGVQVEDAGILDDLDTLEDLASIRRRLAP